MGFWDSFFGFAAANAINEIKEDERQNKRWNDLFYELSNYESSLNELLERIGSSECYVFDVEAVNSGNISYEKQRISTLKRKIEEYISLGGDGKYISDLESIDGDIEKVKYLKAIGALDRQEEFQYSDIYQIKEVLNAEQSIASKNTSVEHTKKEVAKDIDIKKVYTIENVQVWDNDTNKLFPYTFKIVYQANLFEVYIDTTKHVSDEPLALSVDIPYDVYMNAEIVDIEGSPNRKTVYIQDETATFVVDSIEAEKFKLFYDKIDEMKDIDLDEKQKPIYEDLSKIKNIDKMAYNAVTALDDSKVLLNHDAIIMMQRAWSYKKYRNIKPNDLNSLKGENKSIWNEMGKVETMIKNMAEIIIEENYCCDKILYVCWEAIKSAAITFYSNKWSEKYEMLVGSMLEKNLSEEADGKLDNYMQEVISCGKIDVDNEEIVAIFTYYMMDKGYIKGDKYFPAFFDIMRDAFGLFKEKVRVKDVLRAGLMDTTAKENNVIESKSFAELERQIEWYGGKLENVSNNEYYIKYTEFLNKTSLDEYQKRVLQIQYRFLITDAIRGLHKGKIINYIINNHPEIVTAIDLINEDKVFHKFIWTFKKEDEILVEKCMDLLGYEYKKHQIDYQDENVLVYVINVVVDLDWDSDLNKANKSEFDKAREYGYGLFDELKRRMIEHGMCWYTYGNPEKNLSHAGRLFPVRVLFLNSNDDSWAKEGYREDLDHAFRSSWEANVARILNYKQIKWVYEPRFVNLESPDYVKKAHPHLKGGVNYLPDFELEDGTIIEVKGFWDSRSKINVSQFMEQCPDTKYIVIDSDIYQNLVKQYKDIIPNWEDEPVEATNDRIQVVGITFPQRKKFVDVIQPGDVLELVREPANEYDTRAIRVNDKTGNQLGYVAKDCNCIYAPKMDMGFKYEVTVMSKEARVLQCKIKLINADDIILPSLFE